MRLIWLTTWFIAIGLALTSHAADIDEVRHERNRIYPAGIPAESLVPPVSESKKAKFLKAEQALLRPDLKTADLRLRARKLAEHYISDHRLQEAIWVYREYGFESQALRLEKKLQLLMQTGNLVDLSLIRLEGSSKDGARLHQIGKTGLYGILKRNNHLYQRELLAYRLDRLLGLNFVPLTIAIRNDQGDILSLQYYIRDGKTGDHLLGKTANFNSHGYPMEQKKLWLFDYLIDNPDRRGGNWIRLWGQETGKLVAIDHGITMGNAAIRRDLYQPGLIPSDPELLQRLQALDIEALKKEFSDIPAEDFDLMRSRRDRLVREISATCFSRTLRGLL